MKRKNVDERRGVFGWSARAFCQEGITHAARRRSHAMRWKIPVVMLCATLGMGAPAMAQTPAATEQSSALNQVSAFTVEEGADGTYIRIAGTEVATFSVFKLDDPPRLFVDLSNSRLAGEASSERVDNGVISRVGLIEFEDSFQTVARLVIGFEESAHYDVRTEGSDVLVFVDGAGRRGQSGAAGVANAGASKEELERSRQAYERANAELSRTQTQLSLAQQELAQARAQREQARGEERERLEREVASRTQALQRAQQEANARQAEAQALRAQLAGLEAERDQSRERLVAAQRRAEQAEQERQQALSLARAKEEEGERARQRARELESRLTQAEQTLASVNAQRQGAQGQIGTLSERVDEAERRLAAERHQLEEARRREAQLQAQIEQLGKSSSQADRDAIAQVEAERARQRELQARAQAEVERVQREAAAAERELRELNSALTQRDAEIERLRRDVEQAQQAQAREVASAHEAERARLRALNEAIAREEQRVEAIEQARRAEEGRLENLQARRTQEEDGVEAMRQERERMEAELAQARQALASTRDELARAEQARQASERELEQVARVIPVDPKNSNAVRSVRLETDDDGHSRIVVQLDRPGQVETTRSRDGRAVMILNDVALPEHLERTLAADSQGGAVRFVSSFVDARTNTVRMEAELNSEARARLSQSGNELVWEFAPEQAQPAQQLAADTAPRRVQDGQSVTSAPPRYPRVVTDPSQVSSVPGMSRKRITIDLRNADVQNVLRLVATEGGVNIIAGDGVEGVVTMRLRNVPLDQVFLNILQALQLGFEVRGNVIRVAPASVLAEEEAARAEARTRAQRVQPLEVFLLPVNYATADELVSQVQGLLSPRGSVSVDARTNTLIIKDLRENLTSIRMLVETLDSQVPQVLIEARIVETSDTFSRQIGVQWGGDIGFSQGTGNPTGLIFPNVLGLAGGATDGQTPVAGTSSNPNFAVNLPAPVGTGAGGAIGLTMGSVGGAVNLNLRLSALEEAGHAKIVSAPRILTMDNKEASISQGTSIPISVVGAAGVQTVFVDATLELTVTPHVTPDGNIRLSIDATKNEPDFQNTGARGDPTIIQRQATTELLIPDGDTTVIGGIYTRNAGHSVSAVPFLHRIPILGFFFKTQSESERRSELLIFITPRIVNRAESLGGMSAGSVSGDGWEE
ncbi:type IV pilus secretin PilQ [Lujinxingia sediminis]|uniref:Type IV pilus secretin PilQ n=2 Tax=Lujinxingia sediminis TaxID=2480984 RepID=A0ABY0CQW5_9DELT|nr:type IV pilus secretin PilQ [Lujinxingia sediminis]